MKPGLYRVTCPTCQTVRHYESGGFYEERCDDCGDPGLHGRTREYVATETLAEGTPVYSAADTVRYHVRHAS